MPSKDVIDVAAVTTTLATQGASWTAGETSLTSLSAAQRKLLLGATPPQGTVDLDVREVDGTAHAYASSMLAGAPTAADLTSYVQPIRNQGSCGSCVSFASIATVEGTARFNAKDPNLAFDLSEAHLFYGHAKAEGRTCKTGWWPDHAMDALRDKGVVDEACCPYTPGDQALKLCADADERLYKIQAYKTLGGAEEMKDWLATKGPLESAFKVYDDFFAYKTGVYRHKTGDFAGGHAICIIGYDDNERAWLAKNSWGTGWGDHGFFKIGYGECGIDYQMWGVELPRTEGADTWLKRKSITGTWAIAEAHNAAAYINGVGWKAVGGATDGEFIALYSSLTSARASKTMVDVRLVNDRIVEVYVF